MNLYRVEIAVIGASLGGVIAAWRACVLGKRVALVAEFDWLGGQLTSQAVPPDEHRAIERGGAAASYLEFRRQMRAHYSAQSGFVDRTALTEGCNPGDGWVSRLCIEPAVAATYFEALLSPYVARGQLIILRRSTLQATEIDTRNRRRIAAISTVGAHTARVEAAVFIDGTDSGELIASAGLKFRIGKEAQAAFGELDAPTASDENDQQPVTYVVALRRCATAGVPIAKPLAYDFWRDYKLPQYPHPLFSNRAPGGTRGESIHLPFFAEGQTLDWWRYRRIVCAHNWHSPRAEVSLVNWAQNDYPLQPFIGATKAQAEISDAAKALSRCWVYWLQTDAPRDGGTLGGRGYPELQLATDMLGTTDGFAQQVYIRESRRIVGVETLRQNDICFAGGAFDAVSRDDSVGVVWYNMDIHPTTVSGHGVNAKVRPFVLPLGVFIAADCDNLIPGCKNISVTHLVNAATRVHPSEWLIGEVAGHLASGVLDAKTTLAEFAREHLRAFQAALTAAGIPLQWDALMVAHRSNNPAIQDTN